MTLKLAVAATVVAGVVGQNITVPEGFDLYVMDGRCEPDGGREGSLCRETYIGTDLEERQVFHYLAPLNATCEGADDKGFLPADCDLDCAASRCAGDPACFGFNYDSGKELYLLKDNLEGYEDEDGDMCYRKQDGYTLIGNNNECGPSESGERHAYDLCHEDANTTFAMPLNATCADANSNGYHPMACGYACIKALCDADPACVGFEKDESVNSLDPSSLISHEAYRMRSAIDYVKHQSFRSCYFKGVFVSPAPTVEPTRGDGDDNDSPTPQAPDPVTPDQSEWCEEYMNATMATTVDVNATDPAEKFYLFQDDAHCEPDVSPNGNLCRNGQAARRGLFIQPQNVTCEGVDDDGYHPSCCDLNCTMAICAADPACFGFNYDDRRDAYKLMSDIEGKEDDSGNKCYRIKDEFKLLDAGNSECKPSNDEYKLCHPESNFYSGEPLAETCADADENGWHPTTCGYSCISTLCDADPACAGFEKDEDGREKYQMKTRIIGSNRKGFHSCYDRRANVPTDSSTGGATDGSTGTTEPPMEEVCFNEFIRTFGSPAFDGGVAVNPICGASIPVVDDMPDEEDKNKLKRDFAKSLRRAVRNNIQQYGEEDCTEECFAELLALQTTCADVTDSWAEGLVEDLTEDLLEVEGICEEHSKEDVSHAGKVCAATALVASASLLL